jgi:two-component system, sensor histidine kinase
MDRLRSALTAQLQDLGASVRAYPSAKHALAATANDTESPTCIISDYWLPEPYDGLQTIAKLREQFEENVPALLISAASDIDPARLQSIPNLEFALKPVSANTLLSYVKKHDRLE